MTVFGHLGEYSDEARYYLAAALEHYRYARDLLRRVGPAARERFDREGWAYGDPSVFGEPEDRVYEAQFGTLLYVLFDHRFTADLSTIYDIASETSPLAGCLLSEDGTPLKDRRDWSEVGEDLTVVAQVWGPQRHIARLEALLRAVEARRARKRARLRSGLTDAQDRFEIFRHGDACGCSSEPHEPHLVLLAELGYASLIEVIYDQIFDRFVEGSEVERDDANAARDRNLEERPARQTRRRSRRRTGRDTRRRNRARTRKRSPRRRRA